MTKLRRVDDFESVAKALYGEGAWEIVKAATPDQRAKRERTQARIGLATNVVGLAAGAQGLGQAVADAKSKTKSAAKPKGGATTIAPRTKVNRLKAASRTFNRKYAGPIALGAVGLQSVNLAGDAIANRVLARSAKKDVAKNDPKRELQLRALSAAERTAKGLPKPKLKAARKDGAFTVTATVSKAIEDKRQVYGWASITEMDGVPVVDLQGDYVTIDEIEKAAHTYIAKSRKGGDMHVRVGDAPKHVADLIESVVITPEKKTALGLPEDSPTGWWVGMQVNDEDTWNLVKDGKRPMFSIHGSGRRQETEINA